MDINDYLKTKSPKAGRTLVVGSRIYMGKIDRRTLYADAIGLDMSEGEGVDVIHDLEKPLPETFGLFDHIDCCSVLEHVRRPWVMAKHIHAVMTTAATILVSVPFVWRVHGYPSDYWRITAEALPVLFPVIKWEHIAYMAGDELHKKPPAVTIDGHVHLMKSEVVAFGVNPDHARYRH